DIVRSGEVVESVDAQGRVEIAFDRPLSGLRAGEYVYVRAVQEDDGAAWSSPVYLGEPGAEGNSTGRRPRTGRASRASAPRTTRPAPRGSPRARPRDGTRARAGRRAPDR